MRRRGSQCCSFGPHCNFYCPLALSHYVVSKLLSIEIVATYTAFCSEGARLFSRGFSKREGFKRSNLGIFVILTDPKNVIFVNFFHCVLHLVIACVCENC